MTTPIFVLSVFLLFALARPSNTQANELNYTYCQSNSECQPGYCCTIGPIRYSIPQCRPMQDEGDICRPASASTIDMTVGYPDGSELTLKNVHYILCPCADGLSCDVKEGVCREIGRKPDTNRLSIAENKKTRRLIDQTKRK